MNRKTVQRLYRMLRVGIGGQGVEEQGKVVSDDARGAERPLVVLVADGSNIQVIPFTADGAFPPPCALVYPRTSWFEGGAGLSDLQLWIPGGGKASTRGDVPVKFWGFAGRLARRYRGRCLQDLPLFLQEVAFRFNQRDNPQVIETLCRLLGSDRDWG